MQLQAGITDIQHIKLKKLINKKIIIIKQISLDGLSPVIIL